MGVTQVIGTKCKLGLPDVEGEGGPGEGAIDRGIATIADLLR